MRFATRVVAVAAAALSAVVPAWAGSPTTTAPVSKGSVRLVAQTPWVGLGGQMDLTLAVVSPAADTQLEVAVAVHSAITSRSAFQQSVTGRGLGAIVTGGFTSARLDEVERGAGGVLFVRLPVQDPAAARDKTRLQLGRPGVFPVEVTLRGTGTTKPLGRFVTHLVYAPTPAENPLRVAFIVPIHAPPAITAAGTGQRDEMGRGPATIARALQARLDVPVTMDPTPETVLALDRGSDDDRATLEALIAIAARTQTLSEPFVPVSTSALSALDGELSRQFARGDSVLRSLLGVKPDPRTRVLAPGTTTERVAELSGQLVDRVIVPEQGLVALPRRLTPTEPFRLSAAPDRWVEAIAADAGLAEHFGRGTGDVLAAHRLLADLAVLFLDSPGSVRRGVVILPPQTWQPSSPFLDAALAGLASSPILKPVDVDTLFASMPLPSGRRALAPFEPASLPVAQLQAARAAAQSMGSVAGADSPVAERLNDAVLAAESSDLKPRARSRRIAEVHQRIAGEVAKVALATARTVTLTARRGGIPITVSSRTGYPARVAVQLSSSKLLFPDGANAVLELTRQNNTRRFTVQARTSGSFPLRVRVTSPDGELLIAERQVFVRSSAASGVGIFLSAGAAAFLAVWWARHAFGRRRARR